MTKKTGWNKVGLSPCLLEKLFLELRSIKAREMKGKVSKQTHPVFSTAKFLFGLSLLFVCPPSLCLLTF